MLLRALGTGARTRKTAQPSPAKEAAGETVLVACAAEASYGEVQFALCCSEITRNQIAVIRQYRPTQKRAVPAIQNRSIECSAAQDKVVEGFGEEPAARSYKVDSLCGSIDVWTKCVRLWELIAILSQT